MIYHTRTQRGVLLFLLLVLVPPLFLTYPEPGFIYLRILLIAFVLAASLLTYRFEIDGMFLTFEMHVFSIRLYKKVVEPHQISHVKFKRVGWRRKGVVVHTKGINMRIVNFSDDQVFKELNDYANRYEIPFDKTKDYLILEN